MKSILYVGATLMIGASIYGFVDYKNANHDKQFSKMYEPQPVKEPVVEEPILVTKDGPAVVTEKPVAKSVSVVTEKKTVKKRKFKFSEFSRAPLDAKYLEKEIKIEPVKTESVVPVVEKKDN
ncbi:MAG TPA: hypothetical protein VLJ68_03635 [Chitinophagaceae bacterium]|nr:hypothetical protein [Chitinophagaceae bacterium]